MKELGVLICDTSKEDARTLSDRLSELMTTRYTGSIRLRFHHATSEAAAKQLIKDYTDSLALIVIDLAFSTKEVDELSTMSSNTLAEFEVSVIKLKAQETKICYIGSGQQVNEAGYLLHRAYDAKRHEYSSPPQLLRRQEEKSLEVLATQAMSFAAETSSKFEAFLQRLESKIEELDSEVYSINQKLFIQDPLKTQSPPMSQMLIDHTRLIGSSQKDIKKLYNEIDAVKVELDEVRSFTEAELDASSDRIKAIGDRIQHLEQWQSGVVRFRRIFVSLDGGWVNEVIKALAVSGATFLVIKILQALRGSG